MTPVLVLLMPQGAVATDPVARVQQRPAGCCYYRADTIDTLVLRRLLLGSLPAALLAGIGRRTAGWDGRCLDPLMRDTLAWLLLLSAVGIFCRKWLHRLGSLLRTERAEQFKRWQEGLTVAAGAFIGVCVSLTSVGAGALGAVVLLYLYPFRLQGVRLVATDLAHAIPLALVAAGVHWFIGTIDWVLLGILLTGSIPGVLIGVWLSRRLALQWLNLAIGCLLIVSGLKLLAG